MFDPEGLESTKNEDIAIPQKAAGGEQTQASPSTSSSSQPIKPNLVGAYYLWATYKRNGVDVTADMALPKPVADLWNKWGPWAEANRANEPQWLKWWNNAIMTGAMMESGMGVGGMGRVGMVGEFQSAHQLATLNAAKTGTVVRNALELHEFTFANEIVAFRGGTFVGAPRRSFPGIDGTLNGVAASLKETKGGLGAVLAHASKAESQALKAGQKGVEVFIKAPNVRKDALLDFSQKGPLSSIPTQGTVSAVNVQTADGWVRILGKD